MELKERLENYLKQGKQDAREIVCEISERYNLGLTTFVEIFDTEEKLDDYVIKEVLLKVEEVDRLRISELKAPIIVKLGDGPNCDELLKINQIQNTFFSKYLLEYQKMPLSNFLADKETLIKQSQTVANIDKSKYEPFTFEDAELFRDRLVVNEAGEYPGVYQVGQYNKESVIYFKWTYKLAFDNLKFEDGTPFGKLKK